MKKIQSDNSANLTNQGRGRPKGKPNRVTTEFRETIRTLLEDNADNVSKWLKAVAEGSQADERAPDPYKALDMLAKLAEYAAPKLSRTEMTGADNGPVEMKITWLK